MTCREREGEGEESVGQFRCVIVELSSESEVHSEEVCSSEAVCTWTRGDYLVGVTRERARRREGEGRGERQGRVGVLSEAKECSD